MVLRFPGNGPKIADRFSPRTLGEKLLPVSQLATERRFFYPGTGPRFRQRFSPRNLSSNFFVLNGITKDSSGAVLGNCVVMLFRTGDDTVESETVSDGSGNYSFTRGNNLAAYCVAYKSGSPDVAGTTVNTLTGV